MSTLEQLLAGPTSPPALMTTPSVWNDPEDIRIHASNELKNLPERYETRRHQCRTREARHWCTGDGAGAWRNGSLVLQAPLDHHFPPAVWYREFEGLALPVDGIAALPPAVPHVPLEAKLPCWRDVPPADVEVILPRAIEHAAGLQRYMPVVGV